MECMELTHAKLIWVLEGPRYLWYSLRYCLLDIWLIFYSSWWYTWICFVFIVELPLFPVEVWMLANQVRSFYLSTLKFYECVCYHEPCLCLMPYLIALMLVWSSLIKMHVMCHIFKLTFDAFWWRLRSSLGTHPNSPLLWFDLVWHAIFWNHVSLPRYL